MIVSSRRRARSRRLVRLVAGVASMLVLGGASQARAVILPAVTIDGPSASIVAFGGVAMAEDGTGGVVYLKRVGGVAHVFVSRFIGGRWLAPIQVDTGEPFAASWPRIGAANGGQLLVVWATPFATQNEQPLYELLGATLGPGSSRFGEPVIVDPNIGEAVGTSPSIAMSSTAQAYVVYRVVEDFAADEHGNQNPILRAGDVPREEVRVARYLGSRWARLGAVNRDLGVSMRPPTASNAPQVAVNQVGNGIVVWQEPEINGVARIWARRLFGSSVDFLLPVTATSLNHVAINDDADAPSVAIDKLGEAYVAYRQVAGPGSPLPGPRIFINKLPDGESESGLEFKGATVADANVPGGADARLGPPSIDIDEQQDLHLLYDSDGNPQVIEGNDRGLSRALELGPAFSEPEAPAASVVNPQGGGISAWVSANALGEPAAAIREDFPGGAVQTALLGAGAGGPIGELGVGRSGLGDGLIAFQQGVTGNAAIVAAQATAPPAELIVSAPKGWIKPSQALVSWQPALSGDGPLSYSVVLDGRQIASVGDALEAQIDPRRLGDGVHRLQVLATDMHDEATLSASSQLLIDGRPPAVSVTRARHDAIVVRVTDAQSGVDARAVSVSFGDGARASGRAVLRHRYSHAGVYHLTVHTRDKAGNAGVVSLQVSVG